ncbi:MAG: C4-type zinc ribbon domain-containing protein [Terracidiphilus sp.]
MKLQAVELERTRLAHAVRALPAEVAQAEAALAQAQRKAAEASAALSREETLRTRLEREIAGHRQKAARYRVQQDSVTTPAQAAAIEHELNFAESEAARLEDEEFASLERTEAQEAALAEARARVEALAAALDTTRERVSARQKELSAEQSVLNGQRESLRASLEPDLLTRFDRLAVQRGTGLARAEGQQCSGCRMGVRPQTWNQLREGQLLNCDSCGRLLYWDPAIAPPPTPVPPDPALGAHGRAVRK